MWSKTMFWYAVVVTLTVLGTTMSLPLAAIENEPAQVNGNVEDLEQKQEPGHLEPIKGQDGETVVGGTEPIDQTAGKDSVGAENPPAPVDAGPSNVKTEAVDAPARENVQPVETGTDQPVSTVGAARPVEHVTDPNVLKHPEQPYYINGGVQTVKIGPSIPFFMEFLQPFHSFQPFQPFQQFPQSNYEQQPFRYQQQGHHHRHQQQPFDASVDSFDPFVNPIVRSPSFNQLVEAYTNEFRNMLESLDKPMDVENVPNMKIGSSPGKEPISKSTSKTEIIDGHVVQINETTYSNGDDNYKSFYHFKKIQVLPEDNKKIGGEKVEEATSTTVTDAETHKLETNEIKNEPIKTVIAATVNSKDDEQVIKRKNAAQPVPLDDHFQTAAASYYAPFAPYRAPSPSSSSSSSAVLMHYPGGPFVYPRGHPILPTPNNNNYRPGGPGPYTAPISLHGDILVNELAATQQGPNAVLPPDVELIDVNSKPQTWQGGQFYYNNHHYHGNKFPGRKN